MIAAGGLTACSYESAGTPDNLPSQGQGSPSAAPEDNGSEDAGTDPEPDDEDGSTSGSDDDAASLPAEWSVNTDEAVPEAALHWFETLTQARITGDTEKVYPLIHELCEQCTNELESIEALYADGGLYEGYDAQLVQVQTHREADDLVYQKYWADVSSYVLNGDGEEDTTAFTSIGPETGLWIWAFTDEQWRLRAMVPMDVSLISSYDDLPAPEEFVGEW